MSIRDKLIKNSSISMTAALPNSKVFGKKDMIKTKIPMLNVALGGTMDGGLTPGLTQFAGESKHFKTGFCLVLAKAFQDKYPDGAILFYDSEFGSPQGYFEQFGIDMEGVIHTPVTNVEELKFDIMAQIDNLERNDRVLIIVDSIGNLASKKEVEDALDQKSVADMTRAKQIKSLFRMVTPHLTIKDIPMLVVNHTYKEQGTMYPKDKTSGGTGVYYSSDNIYIIGRRQEKDNTSKEIKGYHFMIKVEKSRYCKEGSVVPISVTWENGVNQWSGLLENALEHGCVIKPKVGWYQKKDGDGKSYREKDIIDNKEFWKDIFETTDFVKWINKKYIGPGHGKSESDRVDVESTESDAGS